MGRKRRADVKGLISGTDPDHSLVGSRFIRILEDELEHLHRTGLHGNRELHFDQVVIAHLIAFFNPVLSGLRSIEDLFEQPQVRKRFGSPRIPKSTLSDAQRLFDPDLLCPLIESLRQRVCVQPHDHRLDALSPHNSEDFTAESAEAAKIRTCVNDYPSYQYNTLSKDFSGELLQFTNDYSLSAISAHSAVKYAG